MLPCDVDTLILLVMQTRKPRHREVGSLPKVTQQVRPGTEPGTWRKPLPGSQCYSYHGGREGLGLTVYFLKWFVSSLQNV